MASALLQELKTMATVVKKKQIEDVVGSSWVALAAEEDPQGRRIGLYWSKREQEEEGGEEEGTGGAGAGGKMGARGSGGAEQREQWKDSLAT